MRGGPRTRNLYGKIPLLFCICSRDGDTPSGGVPFPRRVENALGSGDWLTGTRLRNPSVSVNQREVGVELSRYVDVIRRRKWIIIEATVVVTLVALALSLVQRPVYKSETWLLVGQPTTANGLLANTSPQASAQSVDVANQIALVQQPAVIQPVIDSLRLGMTQAQLLSSVRASQMGQSSVISIAVTDGSPKRAADIADALAKSAVDWSTAQQKSVYQQAASRLQERLIALEQQISRVRGQIQYYKSHAGISGRALDLELNAMTSDYSGIQESVRQLTNGQQTAMGSAIVLSKASGVPLKTSPKPVRDGLIGLFAGLALGLVLAFALEGSDSATTPSGKEIDES